MKEGALLTSSSPEKILSAAVGHVWRAVIPSDEFEHIRTNLKISSAIRRADGVHIRFVGDASALSATPTEPELEDAFLFLMNRTPQPAVVS
jgi:hypothetical protein